MGTLGGAVLVYRAAWAGTSCAYQLLSAARTHGGGVVRGDWSADGARLQVETDRREVLLWAVGGDGALQSRGAAELAEAAAAVRPHREAPPQRRQRRFRAVEGDQQPTLSGKEDRKWALAAERVPDHVTLPDRKRWWCWW